MSSRCNILNPFSSVSPDEFSVSDFRRDAIDFTERNAQNGRQYQIVILAAGKGSRLGIDYPKIMYELPYPNAQASILDNMLQGIKHLKTAIDVTKTYVVIDQNMGRFFDKLNFGRDVEILGLDNQHIQGTAVCLRAVRELLDSKKDVILLWGDLALWRVSDLRITVKAHEATKASLTFPTRLKCNPYVAFLRSPSGQPFSVVHANEGARFLGTAEQDCLSFVCSQRALAHIDSFVEQAPSSTEIDFIHFIPYLVSKGLEVLPMPIADADTIYGLNTPQRAQDIREALARYTSEQYMDIFLAP